MVTLIESLDKTISNVFSSGDEEMSTWFLVKENFLPSIIVGAYLLFVTQIGPAIMKNRKPFELRKALIVYNLFLVVNYAYTLTVLLTYLPQFGFKPIKVRKDDITYSLGTSCWIIYMLKYCEFLDTIFFILRKKNNLITSFHVLHHTALPVIGWSLLRTETCVLQMIPVLLNSMVHVVMYSYYCLVAIGPQMKPYLWWKNYITLMQMGHLTLIIIFSVIAPLLTFCSVLKSSLAINLTGSIVFLAYFIEFYRATYGKKTKGGE